MNKEDWDKEYTAAELETKLFGGDTSHKESAQLLASFMLAMKYWHTRSRLHIMLHPIFYLAGFLTGYLLLQSP